jgi:dihydropteroate synthase
LKPEFLEMAGCRLSLNRPLVMGVLNITPDSFSDGGLWHQFDAAVRHAADMAKGGADILDIGGESTRPGADEVSIQEELDRVIPLIEKLRSELDTPISIDTSKSPVMREAVRVGAGMINDVRALQSEDALTTAVATKVPVCLMHMQGQPRTMQQTPVYDNVVKDVIRFLENRALAAREAGIRADDIILDPGFGFGKNLQDNIDLFRAIPQLAALGYPLLVGVSRKSMLGQISGKPVEERKTASVVAAVLAAAKGASILRVHDVVETVDALKTFDALGKPAQDAAP